MRSATLLSTATLLATALALPTFSLPNLRLPSLSLNKAVTDAKVGYLLTAFPLEDEAIDMYLSEGNDAHSWKQLTTNGTREGGAILRSNVGTKGVRDSHLIKSVDGSKYYLIATDLQVNAFKEDFNVASRFGSRSIVIWESIDLVNWSEPRLTEPLVDPSAGNVWAPEAEWDDDLQAYIVVFASRFFPEEPADRSGPQPPNILMYVTTKDFVTFSEQKEYLEPGYPVIDATFLKAEDEGARVCYRWVKDERDYLIYQERSETGLLGTWVRVGGAPDSERISFAKQYSNNEGPLIFRDNVSRIKHRTLARTNLLT
jgi:hypothetical protein